MRTAFLLFVLLATVHIFILSRLQFTAWPEMLTFPFMVDKGFLIYKDFHHVYQPLLTGVLWLFFKFTGFTLISLKIFTWIWILATDFSIFLISGKLFKNKWLSLVPTFLYVILQPVFEGNMMWFDFASVLPVLLSAYFILKWTSEKKRAYLIVSGILLCLGFLVKQQNILITVSFILYLHAKKAVLKEYAVFFVGVFIPLVILFAALLVTGVFHEYLFWTFTLPLYWFPKMPGYQIAPIRKEWLILFLMVALSSTGIMFGLLKKKKEYEPAFICVLFLTSLIFVYPRFSFFHLQPALAYFVICIPFMVNVKRKILLLMVLPVLFYISFYRWRLTFPEIGGGTRFYGESEIKLTEFIDASVKREDKIYLLGPNPAVYVYSDRVPPKPWIENYVWHFEVPGLQEKLISGWEESPPKFIFWIKPAPGEWYRPGTYMPEKITNWIRENYYETGETKNGVSIWSKKETGEKIN